MVYSETILDFLLLRRKLISFLGGGSIPSKELVFFLFVVFDMVVGGSLQDLTCFQNAYINFSDLYSTYRAQVTSIKMNNKYGSHPYFLEG